MTFEDTVMNDDEMNKELRKHHFSYGEQGYKKVTTRIKEAQAEISFKAGYRECDAKWLPLINKIREENKQAGMREVVDYLGLIKTISLESDGYVSHTFIAEKEEWQDKLKEWGMEAERRGA